METRGPEYERISGLDQRETNSELDSHIRATKEALTHNRTTTNVPIATRYLMAVGFVFLCGG